MCCGSGCASAEHQQKLPSSHFIQEELTHSLSQGISARCARCTLLEDGTINKALVCNACEESKHITEYSAIVCKQYLQGQKRGTGYRCNACQFPKCALCSNRPDKAISPNHLEPDGSWYCREHRYPPCCKCRVAPRPPGLCKSKHKFKAWTCPSCVQSQDENQPAAKAAESATSHGTVPPHVQETQSNTPPAPRKIKQYHESGTRICKVVQCHQDKPPDKYQLLPNTHRSSVCLDCEYPFCANNCGTQRSMKQGPMYQGKSRTNLQREDWYHTTLITNNLYIDESLQKSIKIDKSRG